MKSNRNLVFFFSFSEEYLSLIYSQTQRRISMGYHLIRKSSRQHECLLSVRPDRAHLINSVRANHNILTFLVDTNSAQNSIILIVTVTIHSIAIRTDWASERGYSRIIIFVSIQRLETDYLAFLYVSSSHLRAFSGDFYCFCLSVVVSTPRTQTMYRRVAWLWLIGPPFASEKFDPNSC